MYMVLRQSSNFGREHDSGIHRVAAFQLISGDQAGAEYQEVVHPETPASNAPATKDTLKRERELIHRRCSYRCSVDTLKIIVRTNWVTNNQIVRERHDVKTRRPVVKAYERDFVCSPQR